MKNLKRRDKKGRLLRTGETQNVNGLYSYRYTDRQGKRHELTSWRLTHSDPYPVGKKKKKSLRELIDEIEKDTDRKSVMTVIELARFYLSIKKDLSIGSLTAYTEIVNKLEKYNFSEKVITDVSYSDAVVFLQSLITEKDGYGYGYGNAKLMKQVLSPAFDVAVKDKIIKTNPFHFSLNDILSYEKKERIGLTEQQEEEFLNFIKQDKTYRRYYDYIFILLNTGLRISEFCGLTIQNVDFIRKTITVDHQLIGFSHGKEYIAPPKTKKGYRTIPINDDTIDAIKRVLELKKYVKVEPMVDGVTGFIFLNVSARRTTTGVSLYNKCNWNTILRRICIRYRKETGKDFPNVSPHICRHTYCRKMMKTGISIKALQYIMGHSTIDMTLNVYTQYEYEDVEVEIKKVGYL